MGYIGLMGYIIAGTIIEATYQFSQVAGDGFYH